MLSCCILYIFISEKDPGAHRPVSLSNYLLMTNPLKEELWGAKEKLISVFDISCCSVPQENRSALTLSFSGSKHMSILANLIGGKKKFCFAFCVLSLICFGVVCLITQKSIIFLCVCLPFVYFLFHLPCHNYFST